MFPKEGRVKLEGEAYRKFAAALCDLDRNRCRVCGTPKNLSVHHMIKRSRLRLDTKENCITLCIRCNRAEKERRLVVTWIDVKKRTITFRWK